MWHVGEDGSVDFRVRREEFQEMKGNLPECREEGSVEELVREMERAHLNTHLNRTQQDEWFERYVRRTNNNDEVGMSLISFSMIIMRL